VTCGHIEPSVRNSRNGRQISDEQAKAERQRVLRNNKAWRASESVRLNWLKTFIARKSAPKGAHRFVFAELAVGSYRLRDAFDKQHRTACELLAIESRKALIAAMDDASDARAQMIVRPSAECARNLLRRTYIAQSRCSDSPVICHNSPDGATSCQRSSSP
jgi:hypothetical protein